MASAASSVALSPSTTKTGSPGASDKMEKTRKVTPISTGISSSNRLRINRNIVYPLLFACQAADLFKCTLDKHLLVLHHNAALCQHGVDLIALVQKNHVSIATFGDAALARIELQRAGDV